MKRAHAIAGNPRAGMTLLEALIAGTLSASVLGAVALAALSGQRAAAQNLAKTQIETEARRTVDRIAEQIIAAGSAALAPNPAAPFGSATLTFQATVGFAGGARVFGPSQRVRFLIEPGELDNGADDDGDRVPDEGVVEFTRDVGLGSETVVTWVHGVREYLEGETPNGADDNGNGLIDERGLSFSIAGRTLTIRLTLERTGPQGRLMTQTVQTQVRIRN